MGGDIAPFPATGGPICLAGCDMEIQSDGACDVQCSDSGKTTNEDAAESWRGNDGIKRPSEGERRQQELAAERAEAQQQQELAGDPDMASSVFSVAACGRGCLPTQRCWSDP